MAPSTAAWLSAMTSQWLNMALEAAMAARSSRVGTSTPTSAAGTRPKYDSAE